MAAGPRVVDLLARAEEWCLTLDVGRRLNFAAFAFRFVLRLFRHNYPTAHEQAEEAACALALSIVAAVADLNIELRLQRKATGECNVVCVQMGIHSALCVISRMAMAGGDARPVAQGEAPSTARHLQEAAASGMVLVTEAVQVGARSRFDLTPFRRVPAGNAQTALLLPGGQGVFVLEGGKQADVDDAVIVGAELERSWGVRNLWLHTTPRMQGVSLPTCQCKCGLQHRGGTKPRYLVGMWRWRHW